MYRLHGAVTTILIAGDVIMVIQIFHRYISYNIVTGVMITAYPLKIEPPVVGMASTIDIVAVLQSVFERNAILFMEERTAGFQQTKKTSRKKSLGNH